MDGEYLTRHMKREGFTVRTRLQVVLLVTTRTPVQTKALGRTSGKG